MNVIANQIGTPGLSGRAARELLFRDETSGLVILSEKLESSEIPEKEKIAIIGTIRQHAPATRDTVKTLGCTFVDDPSNVPMTLRHHVMAAVAAIGVTDPCQLYGENQTRTTKTGAVVFTCDSSHPKLGEAWRDPDGLIWGDIVLKDDRTVHYMNHQDATNYCTSIGARLPSKEEFTSLREDMGARPGTKEGYSAQVLPNLSDYWFWSSSVYPSNAGYFYDFSGSNGNINYYFRSNDNAVRCVVGR